MKGRQRELLRSDDEWTVNGIRAVLTNARKLVTKELGSRVERKVRRTALLVALDRVTVQRPPPLTHLLKILA